MKRYVLYVNDELKLTTDNRTNVLAVAQKLADNGSQVEVFDFLSINRNEPVFSHYVAIPVIAPLGWYMIDTSHD